MAGLPRLDVTQIVATFGTPVELVRACGAAGFVLSHGSIYKWLTRDRITMDGWLLLSTVHEKLHGRPLNLLDFVR